MSDLIEECISDLTDRKQRNYNDFERTFCVRCRNPACQRAKWAEDLFSARVTTQYDRYFTDVLRAKQGDPEFAQFPDFVQIDRLPEEVSGGWDMPEVPVQDGQVQQARPSTTDTVDEAVRQLSKARGKEEPTLPDPQQAAVDDFVEETERIMGEQAEPLEEPPPVKTSEPAAPPPSPPVQRKPLGNTPHPQGGVVIGGDAPLPQAIPTGRPHVEGTDEWTPRAEKIVKPGAVITMGGGNDD